MSTPSLPAYQYFNYEPVSGALGAQISGVQLNGDLKPEVVSELKQALLDFKVLFFRDQAMNDQDHADFARLVGTPADADFIPIVSEQFPMITRQQYDEYSRMGSDVSFHADDSFHKYPTKMSILRGVDMPDHGGDTIWVDMEKVYDSLSVPMKTLLQGLTAEHSLAKGFGSKILESGSGEDFDRMMTRNLPHTHPLVIRHPETGRKSIYCSELLTLKIHELEPEESELLLNYLCGKAFLPEFECRFKWKNNSVAWWDNRCTVHRGIDDFFPALRVMHRIAIADEQAPALDLDTALTRTISHLDIVPCNALDDEKSVGEAGSDDAPTDTLVEATAIDVDVKFLAKLNKKKAGIEFTPEAAMRVKQIPMMFRGAALSAIFSEATKQGASVVGLEILEEVRKSR
ncbi:TauD/TfdA family dioxygenase [Oceanicoccus sagamiensis]|uniref:TauD/TfdA-like domain-containing protein n=1 Tax=Oceanicoccus sagamiensis TaxID=716816 RepID=A0A1X9NCG7_9GAMM|nr:TauD/TfdA family dioxygenase [Oceanicoccus sagamiensis]ARN73229.1 hypothetical protein BST96_03370 [Oceanicoccus sagamiensis]